MGDVRALRSLESEAQSTIVELARWRRWGVYHTHDSRRSQAGFPDLTLWRDRVIFAELKRVGEKPRPEQRVVLDALAHAGAEVYLWTIDDLAEIGQVLDRRWSFADGALHGRETLFIPRSLWIPGRGRGGSSQLVPEGV